MDNQSGIEKLAADIRRPRDTMETEDGHGRHHGVQGIAADDQTLSTS